MEKARRVAGIVILLVSVSVLLWGLWPLAGEVRTLPVSPADMQLLDSVGAEVDAPARSPEIPEQRCLVLEWPPKIRVGDAEVIRLRLEMDESGMLTAQAGGNQARSGPLAHPDLYETHSVIAEAHLDMAGMAYRPSGTISEGLFPGKPVIFLWSVRPDEAGSYQGTIWLHLLFVPKEAPSGESEQSRTLLSAQVIEIEALDLLGLGGAGARVWGSAGVVIGAVLGLDGVVGWFWKLARRRMDEERDTDNEAR